MNWNYSLVFIQEIIFNFKQYFFINIVRIYIKERMFISIKLQYNYSNSPNIIFL